jgi:hypothetical protein
VLSNAEISTAVLLFTLPVDLPVNARRPTACLFDGPC